MSQLLIVHFPERNAKEGIKQEWKSAGMDTRETSLIRRFLSAGFQPSLE